MLYDVKSSRFRLLTYVNHNLVQMSEGCPIITAGEEGGWDVCPCRVCRGAEEDTETLV